VWGWDFGDTSTVTVHVRRLREKLERDPSDPTLLLTVGRFGYRMVREDELVAEDELIEDDKLIDEDKRP
jgi:DNA-binding winged helix-turn-helix (wHTH) protein